MDTLKPTPVKPPITVSDLEKIDVRVGTVLEAVPVTDSDLLVQLTVDFGDHRRQIVVGMKQERAHPEEVVGRQALFVVNLLPRRMRGQLSEGMLFDIGHADGIRPALAVPERPVPNGVRAG